MRTWLKQSRKGLAAFVMAAAAFLAPCVDDGVTASEILGALVAGMAGGGITYRVFNDPRPTPAP